MGHCHPRSPPLLNPWFQKGKKNICTPFGSYLIILILKAFLQRQRLNQSYFLQAHIPVLNWIQILWRVSRLWIHIMIFFFFFFLLFLTNLGCYLKDFASMCAHFVFFTVCYLLLCYLESLKVYLQWPFLDMPLNNINLGHIHDKKNANSFLKGKITKLIVQWSIIIIMEVASKIDLSTASTAWSCDILWGHHLS